MLTPAQVDLISDGSVAYARLLIADLDPAAPLLTDDQVAVLIDRSGAVLLGAADALDAIATSEVLLAKKIRTQDLTTDGPAVAAELRKQAAGLRARHAEDTEAGGWGIATWSTAPAQCRPEATERPFW